MTGILLLTGISLWRGAGHPFGYVWLILLAAIPLLAINRSISIVMDLCLVWFILWLFNGHQHAGDPLWLLPLTAYTFLTLAAAVNTLPAFLLAGLAMITGCLNADPHLLLTDPVLTVFALTAAASWILTVLPGFRPVPTPPATVDVILCSNSGNTAHHTVSFVEGLTAAGIDVRMHRFHDPRRFHADLQGDALVIAHPVSGWKPPWPLDHYLRTGLPPGGGKPAFILTTAAGGPENAHLPPWLWLMRRGYRVMGHYWSTYPVNIPTFRPGPRALWKVMDAGAPNPMDVDFARECGHRFATGKRAGFPCIVFPFPLIFLGLILDNRWTNRLLYRNRAWKKRCTGCGLCVAVCPEKRLRMVDGRPRATGTCSLCLACVNRCPVNAMHLVGWTEYGRQYQPAWPELLVEPETPPTE